MSAQDARIHIRRASSLTADELCRPSRPGGRLVDVAEALFEASLPELSQIERRGPPGGA